MDHPIGIFDSGYGGLTVLKSIREELSEYDYVYLGDNARAPYGTRSFETVYEYTLQAVEFLFDQGCELVILACNTASAKALRNIQQKNLPFIDPEKRVLGVIRPSAEVVRSYSKTGHIGILGTNGTVQSESYVIEIQKQAPDATVVQEACPLWVPLIENNIYDNEGGRYFVKHHLDELLKKDDQIDTIVLGCTHYPILKDIIEEMLPKHIKVLSQGEIVAASLKDYLNRHDWMQNKCSKTGEIKFYTTEDASLFESRAKTFLGTTIKAEKIKLK